MSDIKSISISEGTYNEYLNGGKKKRKSTKKVKEIKEIHKEESQPIQQSIQPQVPKPQVPKPQVPKPIQEPLHTDTKKIKVELKRKVRINSVKLQPKKVNPGMVSKKPNTKRVRKVFIKGLEKRMKTAKKVQHKMKYMPLAELKKYLIDNKLIKSTSKAPESILRQIASDTQLLDKTTL